MALTNYANLITPFTATKTYFTATNLRKLIKIRKTQVTRKLNVKLHFKTARVNEPPVGGIQSNQSLLTSTHLCYIQFTSVNYSCSLVYHVIFEIIVCIQKRFRLLYDICFYRNTLFFKKAPALPYTFNETTWSLHPRLSTWHFNYFPYTFHFNYFFK
jgi:hypothetical protein